MIYQDTTMFHQDTTTMPASTASAATAAHQHGRANGRAQDEFVMPPASPTSDDAGIGNDREGEVEVATTTTSSPPTPLFSSAGETTMRTARTSEARAVDRWSSTGAPVRDATALGLYQACLRAVDKEDERQQLAFHAYLCLGCLAPVGERGSKCEVCEPTPAAGRSTASSRSRRRPRVAATTTAAASTAVTRSTTAAKVDAAPARFGSPPPATSAQNVSSTAPLPITPSHPTSQRGLTDAPAHCAPQL